MQCAVALHRSWPHLGTNQCLLQEGNCPTRGIDNFFRDGRIGMRDIDYGDRYAIVKVRVWLGENMEKRVPANLH